MKFRIVLIFLLIGTFSANVFPEDVPFVFDNPAQEQRYYGLLEQLRCLVCQNQTLADSHAALAQDLRNEVFRLVKEQDDDKNVVSFLVERYGDFVLYKPPVKSSTWILWFGPFFLLTLAGMVVVVLSRGKKAGPAPLTDEEQERLNALLKHKSETEQ